jgi:hypothetical protein
MLSLAITLALCGSVFSPQAFASVKPGTKCSAQGQTKNWQGKKFTCIKSGKKLIWNRGVVNAIPSPATPIAPPSPASTSEPKSLEIPTSFNDLYEKRNGIPYAAWKSATQTIAMGTPKKISFEQFVGPNTRLPKDASPRFALDLTAKAFSQFEVPERIYFIQYSIDDKSWAKTKFQEVLDSIKYTGFGDSNYISLLIEKNCSSRDCGGALQVATNSGIGFVLQGISTTLGENSGLDFDRLISHEFFHALQRMTIIGTTMKEFPTSWVFEGAPQLAQNLVISNSSYEEYLSFRKSDSSNLYGQGSKVDTVFMTKYLDLNSNNDYFRNVDPYYAYNLGSRIMEILVAIKGPGVLLDLYRETASKGFESGFESAIGVSWTIASPIINKTIVKQLQEGK